MEKFIKIFLLLILISSFSSSVFAADPFFDKEFKQYEDEYRKGSRDCWNLKTNKERTSCEKSHREKFANDPRNRGSKAYFEKHYKPLDFEALDQKFLELKVLQKKAPDISRFADREHGVVSQAILQSELNMIYALQSERAFAMRCENDKAQIERLELSLERELSASCKQYFAEKEVEERLRQQGKE